LRRLQYVPYTSVRTHMYVQRIALLRSVVKRDVPEAAPRVVRKPRPSGSECREGAD
jgi:hypothetical protein